MLLRVRALITSLVFDHSLRVRVVAAPPSSTSSAGLNERTRGTPDLSGLIANLATSDLANILGGTEFLLIALGLGFLYFVLGWAAFAGLAVMLVLLPVPAWLSARMARVQEAKMRATDRRVQSITEGLGVLRMLKLSGWEGKVCEEVQERREEELWEQWRLKWVDAVNNIVSFAIPLAHMVVSFAVFVGFSLHSEEWRQEGLTTVIRRW
jgi:ABC-type multidrug transport system fused ATPase/permease subunit